MIMNEKCKFLANGVCASPINNKEIFCENIPAEWCYYKQLQELKANNGELKDTVTCLRVELDKQKTRLKNHIAKLEQENEELKDKIKKIQNRLSQIEYTASIDVRELRYDLIRIIENLEG